MAAMATLKTLGRTVFTEIHCKSRVSLVICSIHRGKHSLSVRKSSLLGSYAVFGRRLSPVTTAAAVRWNSSGTKTPIVIDEATLPPIPTPPVLPDAPTPEVAESAASLSDLAVQLATEPSLQTYGLGGWTPVGMVQQGLEFLHITCDLPWWGSIALGTLVLRTIVFPAVVLSQRNAAKMMNNMPQMTRIQEKMTEARNTGNNFEAARLGQEMVMFMKEKKMNPLMNMLPPLIQAPLFISMFMGLRKMCNVPVESLRTGGIFWFTDLTVPDQFYLLPIMTSTTLYVTIMVGADSARASSLGMMRYVLYALPVVIFPFTVNFPGAVLCYWATSNMISLVQVAVLRIPKVRAYFKIEPIIKHPPELTAKKGFVKGFKESYSNMKLSKKLGERQHVDSITFKQAGRAPIQRTFKYDPTKTKPTTNELLAKKKTD